MKRHIPGLHSSQTGATSLLEGLLLVRVDRAFFCWQPRKPFVELRFVVLKPQALTGKAFVARLYYTERALWKFAWFLRDFGYDADLLSHDEVDVRALLGLVGVVRTSHTTVHGRSYQNLDGFAPAKEWPAISSAATAGEKTGAEP